MAVPATTGKLCTKVSEMEIGDYIKIGFRHSDRRYVIGGNMSGATEIPLSGVVTPYPLYDSFWYGIKVATGLIISDRVSLNSQSWDQLNSGKFIEGILWNGDNIIPTMTSNTSPSGVASASSEYGANYEAWIAFDKLDAPIGWRSDLQTGWLAYDFQVIRTISGYGIKSASSGNASLQPKDWTFEGWSGTEWVALDRQVNQSGTNFTKKLYPLKEAASYTKYRINVTANNGHATLLINELELYETVGTIRSLTGGVAYADANENKSLTDKGFGAWPTNNEWDKYIVNFPLDKVQQGKTLDDIFHWGVRTHTQDTPVNGLGTANPGQNIFRVWRGFATVTEMHSGNTTFTNANLGFRPVFEYKES